MTLDARQLKQSYGAVKWVESSAREYLVLAWLNARLARLFEGHVAYARLAGVGAGSASYVDRSYTGARDAFDIEVLVDGRPCCWVEVTGENAWEDLAGYEGDKGEVELCVGSWKLRKARELGVVDRVWFAFVITETRTVKVLYARYLDYLESGEAPWLARKVLRRGENESLCLKARHWKKRHALINWIKHNALLYAYKGVG